MRARERWYFVAAVLIPAAFFSACGGLPGGLRDQIATERDRLPQAQRELGRAKEAMRDAAADPSVATGWSGRLTTAQGELDRAKRDGAELDKVEHSGARDSERRAQELVRDERTLRESALRDSEAVEIAANHWIDFRRNTPHYLAAMQEEYDKLHAEDLGPVAKKVEQAGQDWPNKKADLDGRLAALREESEGADSVWSSIGTAREDAAAGKATGAETAELIQANDTFYSDVNTLTQGEEEVGQLTRQLYNAWDKILTDLDKSREGLDTVYREKVKTVTTHYVDVPAKKTEVTSAEDWTDVSAGAYRSVENDLGMAIAHKDAGLYDSEAQTTPQPPGFAYIASPEVGSNQYGYWTHEGGTSFWTWLPEYLIMRDLFWGHSYRPIVINEYRGYETARRYGRSYYGQETPASPPEYGTHGTFTEQHYAGSRYVQSGGFGNSKYASRSVPGDGVRPEARPEPATRDPESGAGKRFGGAPSMGKRFGGPSRSVGRSFGRRR